MDDKCRYELLRVIGALQDAYAYVRHTEELSEDRGDLARIVMLRKQIMNAIDHASILYETLRRP